MLLLDNVEVKFGKFPNGESNLNFNKLSFHSSSTITLKYESDIDICNLYILKRYMDDVFSNSQMYMPRLVILYMPYSRMDRRNDFFTFNLKYVADLINAMNFAMVTVYDSHSDVTAALLNNYNDVSSINALMDVFLAQTLGFRENLHVFFPDAGAQKRYDKGFGYPQLVGMKSRDFSNGSILKYEVHGHCVKDSTIVIIDDLCSKGGTFMAAGNELKDLGAGDIYLIVGHCEETVFQGDLLNDDSPIKKIYTTNSILWNPMHHKIYVHELYKKETRYEK